MRRLIELLTTFSLGAALVVLIIIVVLAVSALIVKFIWWLVVGFLINPVFGTTIPASITYLQAIAVSIVLGLLRNTFGSNTKSERS